MSRKSLGSRGDRYRNSPKENIRSELNNSGNMSDDSLNSTKDSREDPLMRLWNLKFLNKSSRSQRMSNAKRSPYSRTPTRRERSYTDDPVVSNLRKSDSNSVFSRLSLPGGSGLSSPVYSDADAWVTDAIAEKSSTPRRCAGKWTITERAKGPFIGSYQLLGDSLLVRFADQILKSPARIGEHGKFCNGYCVGGQTIADLDQKVSKDFKSTDVLVMIGTNDFLRRSRFQSMKNDMKSLLDFLGYTAGKVVILTVPPIPRLESSPGYWDQWESYNEWLKNLHNGKTIKVIDVAPLFMLESRKPDLKAFESFMGYGDKKRVDHIHLNRLGLLKLHREITKQLNID